jgi:hypothetical protein
MIRVKIIKKSQFIIYNINNQQLKNYIHYQFDRIAVEKMLQNVYLSQIFLP